MLFWRFRDDAFVIQTKYGSGNLVDSSVSTELICLSKYLQSALEVMKQWQMLRDKIRYASSLSYVILLTKYEEQCNSRVGFFPFLLEGLSWDFVFLQAALLSNPRH